MGIRSLAILGVIASMSLCMTVYGSDSIDIVHDPVSTDSAVINVADGVNISTTEMDSINAFINTNARDVLSYIAFNLSEELSIDNTSDYKIILYGITSSGYEDVGFPYKLDVIIAYDFDEDDSYDSYYRLGVLHFKMNSSGGVQQAQFNGMDANAIPNANINSSKFKFVISKTDLQSAYNNGVSSVSTKLDLEPRSQYTLNLQQPWCQSTVMASISEYYKYGEGGLPYVAADVLLPVVYDQEKYDGNGTWVTSIKVDDSNDGDNSSEDEEDKENEEAKYNDYLEALSLDPDMEYRFYDGLNPFQVRDGLEIMGCGDCDYYNSSHAGNVSALVSSIKAGKPSVLTLSRDNSDYGHVIAVYGRLGSKWILGFDPVFKNVSSQICMIYSPGTTVLGDIDYFSYIPSGEYEVSSKNHRLYSVSGKITPDSSRENLNRSSTYTDINRLKSRVENIREQAKLIESQSKLVESIELEETEKDCKYLVSEDKLKRAMLDTLGLYDVQVSTILGNSNLANEVEDIIKDNTQLYTVSLLVNLCESEEVDGVSHSPYLNIIDLASIYSLDSVVNNNIFSSNELEFKFIKRAMSIRRHVCKVNNMGAGDVKKHIQDRCLVVLVMQSVDDPTVTCEYVAVGVENIESNTKYDLLLVDPYDLDAGIVSVPVNVSNFLNRFTVTFGNQEFKTVKVLTNEYDFGVETYDLTYNNFGDMK